LARESVFWTYPHRRINAARSWLARGDVVISVDAIAQPDWNAKTFHVHMTKEQTRNGPDVDSKKPISRQQEIAMRDYFGPPTGKTPGTTSSLQRRFRPGGNFRCRPVKTGTCEAGRIWLVTRCVPRMATSGDWSISSWMKAPGTLVIST